MKIEVKKKLLCPLAAAAIGFSPAGLSAAQLELEAIPESLIGEFLDDVEEEGRHPNDLVVLVSILAGDSRRTIRARLARLLGQMENSGLNESVQEAYARLVCDKDPVVKKTAIAGMTKWFQSLNALERTTVLAEWSMSEHSAVREAMARVLAGRPGVELGADLAVDHLSRDPGWRVRRAMAKAARARFRENPASYAEVLDRLSEDVHRLVRRTAKHSRDMVVLSQQGAAGSA